jgi:hypothetical protein
MDVNSKPHDNAIDVSYIDELQKAKISLLITLAVCSTLGDCTMHSFALCYFAILSFEYMMIALH